jgi:hypothetical protein
MSQRLLIPASVLGALGLLLSACGGGQSDAHVNNLRNRPIPMVENMATASQKLGRPLVGVVRSSSEVQRCVLVFLAGAKSPWISGKPGFEVYALPPAVPNESPEELKAIVDRVVKDASSLGTKLGSSLTENPEYLRRASGHRIRYWVRSGLFVMAKTGFSDLVLNEARQLAAVAFGSYFKEAFTPGPGAETLGSECVLQEPLQF